MWTTQARQRYAWTRRKEGLRLTNAEWALIEPLLPQHSKLGRPWTHERRTVLDAILHLLRTGCAWTHCQTGHRHAVPSTSGSGTWWMVGGWRGFIMHC